MSKEFQASSHRQCFRTSRISRTNRIILAVLAYHTSSTSRIILAVLALPY
jgi:hypothetical protein